jgi:hypothetical protein
MVNDPKMNPEEDRNPVTRSEFRTEMTALSDRFEASRSEFRTAMAELERRFEDAKRYSGILHESLLAKIDLILEAVMPLGERIGRHETRLNALETEVDVIKAHLRARR